MLSGAATIAEGGASAPPLAYAQQLTVGGVMCLRGHLPKSTYICRCSTARTRTRWSVPWVMWSARPLPVGGSSTHAVLSAHSGMASSKLFSDIDQLTEGDVFYIHVLGETLAYKVDAIHTVLPTDTSAAPNRGWQGSGHTGDVYPVSGSTHIACWCEAIGCRMCRSRKRLPPQKNLWHLPGRGITSPAWVSALAW